VVTRKEVAKQAGVSEATLSRVFNGIGPMKEETKQRVLKVAKELDYHPNAIAQSFARRRSGNLGVVLPYVPKVHLFSTYYFSEVLGGIGEQVRELGYDMLLMLLSPNESADYARLYRSQKVDACVILGSKDTPEQRHSLQQLKDQSLPFCVVNQHFEGLGFNEVDADHVQGSYLAARHLADRGFRRIAFLNGSPQYSNSSDRLKGYRKALNEAGLMNPEDSPLFEGNYSRKSGYEAAARLWEIRDGVEAIFVANDRMAIGLMQGLRERGWEAGRDYALVAYDDSDAAKLSDPPLTSVHVPFYEMGKQAARKVLEQAAAGAGTEPFHIKQPTSLIIRKSSECNNE
jgi:DNA-binding LacI/PurR family transcriptional regulator